ncbi:hypothetical protein OJF2_35640 [Aquisphaera giovannonii]|uniref:Uncharacterized protein n=1 Tax=Aquisphaera giovannonii TaxID=406548 RepID=A0A5B9W494_9BACT|nr:hypothetical protein [Aquisphaera giovannonii]QEH35019.1 hypothetical protein OJF2_35640 [Aquisphaera giovannonii]
MNLLGVCLVATLLAPAEGPLRIDSVVPLPAQPHASDPAVIWYDDFDGPEKRYTEARGGLDDRVGFGGAGRSMTCRYEEGERGVGDRKVFFGDSPTGRVVRRGETFTDVYWRVYVKHQPGWAGGGEAKLSRITSIASPNWSQAMIGHVWTSGETLTLDPATGVRGDRVVTTRYNDFANLRWLGNRPPARFPISSPGEAGWWVCVEARVKLNTPGKRDGLMQLWIDGRLESERTGLDWRGRYDRHGLNAVFLESYWNDGSPVGQTRWLDQFVISTRPIGPVVAPRRPVLLVGGPSPGPPRAWEAEVAGDDEVVAWRSKPVTASTRVTVDASSGSFAGPLAGADRLAAGARYAIRVRSLDPAGSGASWSGWHQAFRTASE